MMKLTAIVVASLFHVATLKELPEYSREDGFKGLQLSDYEADAEINPDKEVPDGVPVISSLVQGTFYQGDAALTDAEKAMIRMMDQGELTELENYLKYSREDGARKDGA
jgi:hypothetical protein